MMDNSQVISQLVAFKNVHSEIEGIQNEIKQLRIRMKPRLDELRTQYKKLENILIEYLEKNNEPGIQYQDQVFMLLDKAEKSKKKIDKNEAVIALLKKYNVQNPNVALEEVRKIFPIRSTKTVDSTKSIKVKKT